MAATRPKLDRLRTTVRSVGSAAVAFSGGSDSSLVAKVAKDELGEKALAVTVDSPLFPREELRQARHIAKAIGIRFQVISVDPFKDHRFSENPQDRCYLCKSIIFGEVVKVGRERSLASVLDGSNADDTRDHRPGSRAKDELGVRSPLVEAGLGKDDVMEISRVLKLSTHSKEPNPCLATRVPYGHMLTPQLLARIESAEAYLSRKGFRHVRVRAHGPLARIEVAKEQVHRLTEAGERTAVVRRLNSLGFTYVTVDLRGYRSGSMDEVLVR